MKMLTLIVTNFIILSTFGAEIIIEGFHREYSPNETAREIIEANGDRQIIRYPDQGELSIEGLPIENAECAQDIIEYVERAKLSPRLEKLSVQFVLHTSPDSDRSSSLTLRGKFHWKNEVIERNQQSRPPGLALISAYEYWTGRLIEARISDSEVETDCQYLAYRLVNRRLSL